MTDIFAILISVIVVGLFLYFGFRFYIRIFRFFSDNLTVVIDFLEKKNLKLLEIYRPSGLDWKFNPFGTKDSFFIIDIFLPFALLSHRIVIASNKNDKRSKYWMRISLTWFGKPKIEFKLDNSRHSKKELIESKPDNIRLVKENCPACNAKLTSQDKKCPDCGLYFE